MTNCYLIHHGVKGQKWGVRRYQYVDGSLTPRGKKRLYAQSSTGIKGARLRLNMTVKDAVNSAKTISTGRQYVDGVLNKGTTFARIQTSKNFENFAFYATYKKEDMNKYMGLFGKNLKVRSERDAVNAEKKYNVSGADADLNTAKALREKSNNTKVHQLKLETVKKLRIPSDENAGDITAKLLKEQKFKDNVTASIQDSKEKMRRPNQQMLFNQAQKAMKKDPEKMTHDSV